MKGSSLLVLLLIFSVQGRGCDILLKRSVENLLSTIKTELRGFRQVFPKNYEISHHYNDSLLCDTDPCCVFRAAVVLSDSWSQLLLLLWSTNLKYSFIAALKEKLDSIANKRFQEDPDPSILPSVSSTPEALLHFTSALFSTWLEKECPVTVQLCEFPVLPLGSTEEESPGKRTDEEKENVHPHPTQCWMREGDKEKLSGSGTPSTGSSTSIHLTDPSCFSLFWTVLVAIFLVQ